MPQINELMAKLLMLISPVGWSLIYKSQCTQACFEIHLKVSITVLRLWIILLNFMCNIESETHATIHAPTASKRSQFMSLMTAVSELLMPRLTVNQCSSEG